jgi:hypothetical protein
MKPNLPDSYSWTRNDTAPMDGRKLFYLTTARSFAGPGTTTNPLSSSEQQRPRTQRLRNATTTIRRQIKVVRYNSKNPDATQRIQRLEDTRWRGKGDIADAYSCGRSWRAPWLLLLSFLPCLRFRRRRFCGGVAEGWRETRKRSFYMLPENPSGPRILGYMLIPAWAGLIIRRTDRWLMVWRPLIPIQAGPKHRLVQF